MAETVLLDSDGYYMSIDPGIIYTSVCINDKLTKKLLGLTQIQQGFAGIFSLLGLLPLPIATAVFIALQIFRGRIMIANEGEGVCFNFLTVSPIMGFLVSSR